MNTIIEPLESLPDEIGPYWFWPDESESYYLVVVSWPQSHESLYAYPVNYNGIKDLDGKAEFRGCLPLHRVEKGKWYKLPTPEAK